MLHLRSTILSPLGGTAPLGRFLLPSEAPFLTTVDAWGAPAKVLGAVPVNYEDLAEPILGIEVEGYEKAPLLATAGTRVWSRDREGWVRVDELTVGECLRAPVPMPTGLGISWARVRKIARGAMEDRIWVGEPRMCGTLRLARGSHSFAVPGAFIHAGFEPAQGWGQRVAAANYGARR